MTRWLIDKSIYREENRFIVYHYYIRQKIKNILSFINVTNVLSYGQSMIKTLIVLKHYLSESFISSGHCQPIDTKQFSCPNTAVRCTYFWHTDVIQRNKLYETKIKLEGKIHSESRSVQPCDSGMIHHFRATSEKSQVFLHNRKSNLTEFH